MASIVGGSTAGLTIAARLTESSNTTVLVLEAGADHTSDMNVLCTRPLPSHVRNLEYDWDCKTVPQVTRLLSLKLQVTDDNSPPRTTKSSFTSAANSSGAPARSTSCSGRTPPDKKSMAGASSVTRADLGTSWPRTCACRRPSSPRPSSRQLTCFSATSTQTPAAPELGRAVRSDPRDGKALGGYVNLLNIDGATRSFAANAYLGPARQRPNLKVVTGVVVTKIVSERSGGKIAATGVRWTKNGSTYEATAAREVVLAAGSIASPQLLEVSGIGGEWLLRRHGIEVFVDNPNVSEICWAMFTSRLVRFVTKPGVPTKEDYANATYFQEHLDLYIQNKTGHLSSAGASSAFLSLKHIASTLDLDALSLGVRTGKTGLDERYRLLIRDLKSEAIAQELTMEGGISPQFSSDTTKLFSANAQGNFVSILGVLEHPFSRVSVHIQSLFYAVAELAADFLKEAERTT
ncbi:GMC oxidoreductase [Colletotrichum asianum]